MDFKLKKYLCLFIFMFTFFVELRCSSTEEDIKSTKLFKLLSDYARLQTAKTTNLKESKEFKNIELVLAFLKPIEKIYEVNLSAEVEKNPPYYGIYSLTKKLIESIEALQKAETYDESKFNNFISDFSAFYAMIKSLPDEISRKHIFESIFENINFMVFYDGVRSYESFSEKMDKVNVFKDLIEKELIRRFATENKLPAGIQFLCENIETKINEFRDSFEFSGMEISALENNILIDLSSELRNLKLTVISMEFAANNPGFFVFMITFKKQSYQFGETLKCIDKKIYAFKSTEVRKKYEEIKSDFYDKKKEAELLIDKQKNTYKENFYAKILQIYRDELNKTYTIVLAVFEKIIKGEISEEEIFIQKAKIQNVVLLNKTIFNEFMEEIKNIGSFDTELKQVYSELNTLEEEINDLRFIKFDKTKATKRKIADLLLIDNKDFKESKDLKKELESYDKKENMNKEYNKIKERFNMHEATHASIREYWHLNRDSDDLEVLETFTKNIKEYLDSYNQLKIDTLKFLRSMKSKYKNISPSSESSKKKENDNFKYFLLLSVVLHGLVVLGFLFILLKRNK